jgi:uncharacterized protein (TIRG00374 family)
LTSSASRFLTSRKATYLISAIIGIGLILTLFFFVDIKEVYTSILNVSISWVILTFIALFLSDMTKGWRWKTLLIPSKSVKFSNAWAISIIGSFVNTLFPIRAGELAVRPILMEKREHLRFFAALSSIIVERTVDVIVLVAWATVMLFTLPSGLGVPEWFSDTLGIIGAIALAVLATIMIGTRRKEGLFHFEGRVVAMFPISEKWKKKLDNFFRDTVHGAEGISQRPNLTLAVFLQTVVVWLFNVASVYAIFKAFSFTAPPVVIITGAVLLLITYALPAPPAYLGSLELYWSVIFLGLGLPTSKIISIALLYHLVSVLLIVVEGYVAMFWLGLGFRKMLEHREAVTEKEGSTTVPQPPS